MNLYKINNYHYYYIRSLKQFLTAGRTLQKSYIYMGPFSIQCRELGFHGRGVYPTLDNSCIKTARAKQENETDN